jgi:REP element-mobilizing transposase RayT
MAQVQNNLLAGFHSRGVLPHLKREGAAYFVTFREANTLPREVVVKFKAERQAILSHALAAKRPLTWHEQEQLFLWYSERVDHYLDCGHGNCHLRNRECAELVADALRFFQDVRYELSAWVVMPNHVHVVFSPIPPRTVSTILHTWKSFTSHGLQKLLPNPIVPFWQNESYDHLVRNDDDFHRCCRYTVMNPVNAGLCAEPHLWPWSSAYKGGVVTRPSRLRVTAPSRCRGRQA